MSLLFFIDGGFNNGVGSLLVEQVKSIHKQYPKVHVASCLKEQEKDLIKSISDNNIPILLLPGLELHKNYRNHIKLILNYIIDNNIKVVHVQSNWQLALIAVIKYRLMFKHRFKIIYTIHAFRNNQPLKSWLAKIIIGTLLFLFVDQIICPSNFLRRNFILLRYKIILLPLGISNLYFTESYKKCPVDSLKLIFPAQFRIGKNHDLLLKAFHIYINKTNDHNALLTLPGDGPLLNDMIDLANLLGIQKYVFFPGRCTQKEIKKMYEDSNIAIISSNSETFGFCIVEPFVIGRSILTRHVGIADDIIVKNINGYFFNTINDLVELLSNISNDINKLNIIGENNYKERDQFRWEHITSKYMNIIHNL